MNAKDQAQLPRYRRWPSRLWRAASGFAAAVKDYAVRVFEKADDDNIFVLASGLTFSVLVAAVPFLFIIVALISLTLERAAQSAGIEPIEQLRRYLDVIVPFIGRGGAGRSLPEEVIESVLARGQAIGIISFGAFLWFSTRLFGSIRAVLREVFDLRQSRGIVQGKIFDAEMVLVSSVLLILNIGITVVFNLAKAQSFEFLGLSQTHIGILEAIYAQVTAFAFIFLLFLLLYKYVPARRIPWRMAVAAAVFTAVCFELLKLAFTLYLTQLANFRSIYGGIATLVIVVIWLYYLAIVFVLGAEVAQVHELRRVRRHQMEVLE
ncbi:MAG: YihY/virulence factor BrkB family protein [Gemmatimonadetes bacterium]|uniref:YihY/virulence factor BrkB family protein n=1 Tax=Candidatus Kutchimonas denitrificans TaxID=3056748 RepID=A0AAE5C9D0_9BACT|nr:YihY/virulence factor BrkB family protein [Gemmatimonadota bacterium]NIR75361.1 YihY/virulence factor BrkB family protein [Candidatus Kutchimonas denitrificans]NIS01003.1 YihY/virulence factor BrkB family protein [Gemmatimonadota bacterium]NIT66627.1 YihY/virulence factor BrkB family protein [Gemmatimonadota bacterium]NIU53207.1 YihY family inner membrane protein [Gemmatimonadota bacterium]